jgi:hypothetical protein
MSSVLFEGLSSGWLTEALGRGPAALLAYLDQGSGSYILQTFATGLFSLGYFARRVWRKLTSPWGRKDG